MSVYNGEATLAKAIESVLQQSLREFEFIIIDDGSSDTSPQILEHYARQDSRIRVITQKNEGLTRALNRGIESCIAPYIARADADDQSLTDRLEKQVQYMNDHPDVVLLGSGAHLLNAQGNRYQTVFAPEDDKAIRRAMRKRNIFFHSATLIRSSAIHQVSGYDSEFVRSQDYDLWLRLLDVGQGANLPEALVELDQGPSRVSRKQARKQVSASLKAKWKNRKGSVLKGTPLHIFWWQLRGYIIPPGTLNAIKARR
jgi:glycosyltransferase involved in cell wall biosynthesis